MEDDPQLSGMEDEEPLSGEESGGMYENVDPREDMAGDPDQPEDYSGEDEIDRIQDDADAFEGDKNEEADEAEDGIAKDENEGYTNAAMIADIEEKEKELLEAKKQWQMAGEVLATDRPVNSLVDEMLDFQLATKLPLVHTVLFIDCGEEAKHMNHRLKHQQNWKT